MVFMTVVRQTIYVRKYSIQQLPKLGSCQVHVLHNNSMNSIHELILQITTQQVLEVQEDVTGLQETVVHVTQSMYSCYDNQQTFEILSQQTFEILSHH